MEKKDNFIWTSANYFEIMLHREIVSGSKQHKAIRKMRNRFKTDPPTPQKNPLKRKTKNKQQSACFLLFLVILSSRSSSFFSVRFCFSHFKTKKISRPPGTPADLSRRFTEFLPKPIENLSKTIFFCQDEASLWKPNPAPRKKPCTDCLCILTPLLLLQQTPLLLLSQLKRFWLKLKQKRLKKTKTKNALGWSLAMWMCEISELKS